MQPGYTIFFIFFKLKYLKHFYHLQVLRRHRTHTIYFYRINIQLFSMMGLIQKLSECILINVSFRNKENVAIKFSSTRTYLPQKV